MNNGIGDKNPEPSLTGSAQVQRAAADEETAALVKVEQDAVMPHMPQTIVGIAESRSSSRDAFFEMVGGFTRQTNWELATSRAEAASLREENKKLTGENSDLRSDSRRLYQLVHAVISSEQVNMIAINVLKRSREVS